MANAMLDYVPFPNDPNFNLSLGWLLSSLPAFYEGRNVKELGEETLRTAREALSAALAAHQQRGKE